MENNQKFNKSKKVPVIIGSAAALIGAVTGVVLLTGDKPSNEDAKIDTNKPVAIQETLEYGENIQDKTFVVNTGKGSKDANFSDLAPKVDTMIIGETEHDLKVETYNFDVTVLVKDTKKPVFTGIKDKFELESTEKLEEQLKAIITAEDPVDGKVDVKFNIVKGENGEFKVTAEAEDKNGNKSSQEFVVTEKAKEVTKDDKENPDVVATKPAETKPSQNNGATTQQPTQTKPAQTKPSQQPAQTKPSQQPAQTKPAQPKPSEQPKDNKPVTKPGTGSGGTTTNPNPSGNDGEDASYALKKIGSVPGGASLTSSESHQHKYSFSKALSGGGKITKVDVSSFNNSKKIKINGIDNSGAAFMATYSKGTLMYVMSIPNLTSADESTLYTIGGQFGAAYGF